MLSDIDVITTLAYIPHMKIVRLKPYLRACKGMSLKDADMREIELGISAAPGAHPMIKGLRGVRKARIPGFGRGKRSGGRVIYYVSTSPILFMLVAYQKNEQDDLSPSQRKAILAAIESIKGGGTS
jgi:hypothetical protein